MLQYDRSLVWFRRDLRSFDHAALHHALQQSKRVFCVFVFDTDILSILPPVDRRVEFIHASVTELDAELRKLGGALIVRHAAASQEIPRLAKELGVDAVFVNRDYEPQAVERDAMVEHALAAAGQKLLSFKDQVIFEQSELLTKAGHPFSVFTPYKNAWLAKIAAQIESEGDHCFGPYLTEQFSGHFSPPVKKYDSPIPPLADLGFQNTDLAQLRIPTGMSGAQVLLGDFISRLPFYDTTRNYPAIKGPSYLSVHLRFGTLSIRTLAKTAFDVMRTTAGTGTAVWLSELVWRDFYFMILHHHPHVVGQAFKPAYDRIEWESGPEAAALFEAWCEGRTGYPLVDAGMLQLNQTGYMHNRLRMVTATFLIKDCGVDWRWGERYFAEKLNDFDLAANNGGWQWCASSGCDAQPYFRIFNPVTQSENFDAQGKFIRRYLPQLAKLADRDIHAPWEVPTMELEAAGITLGKNYPYPVVEHAKARQRTLERYSVVKT